MTFPTKDAPQPFTQLAGETDVFHADFTSRLATGDYLVGAPVATITTLVGSTPATATSVALESGDAPKRVSLLLATPAGRHEYRLDVQCSTHNGATLILPGIVKVLP